MPLAAGSRLGSYEVLSPLGAGGMGEVYRATDSKLGRDVAIKILPEAFALDAERRARFEREARTLAALNHPNIAHIHGLEERDGLTALVMELVDGDDLSAHIARGPIAPADAVPIALQIAAALEAAHEQGIVHRDLKPANVKVRADGTVKVLDFGLAKAMDAAGASASALNSPTLTARATQLGTILGTAAYMAPEQARGKATDKRADIWAFGVVLYEMLAGRRAFPGDDISDVLAAVLRQDIDWTALPPDTPARLRQLLQRCLDRDVKTRLRDIGEARVTLADPGAPSVAPRGGRRVTVLATAAFALAAAVISALGVLYLRPSAAAPASPLVRLPFEAPDAVVSEVGDATISPDGGTMLFSGRAADGRRVLWVRALDSPEATPLPDTEDAIEPFWSWDSKSIAFGAQGKLKRLDLGATRAQTLTDAARSNNGSWSRSGVIVFSPDYRSPLFKVPATGGQREQVTRGPGEKTGHRYPMFLPDGRHFLYWSEPAVRLGSLDSQESKELLAAGPAIYAPPGWLLYVRSGLIVAHAFDAGRLELSGEPLPIGPAEPGAWWARGARLSASETGVLAIARAPTYDYQLAWFDGAGAQKGTLGPVRSVNVGHFPRISPDGSRVVVQINDSKAQNQDLWIGDLIRGTFERFTTTQEFEQLPVWSADGRHVFASTVRSRNSGIHRIPVGGGADDLVAEGTIFPADVTRDGRWLFYLQRGASTRADVWALALTDGLPSSGAKPLVVFDSEFDDGMPHVSPDGRWLAYDSDVTGTSEVYVRRLTDGRAGPATRVSTGHGKKPRWSHDGRTLFFVSAPQGFLSAQMMSVPVTPAGDTLQLGAATVLFKARMLPNPGNLRDYDIAPDGRFLVGTVVGAPKNTAATVVLNWPAAMRK